MENSKIMHEKALLAAFTAALLAWGFYVARHISSLWFLSDDTHWIWASATVSAFEMFFVPERYRALASNFTPMLGLSFKMDWLLFGLDPRGYMAHNLLSLAAAATALFCFVRLYAAKIYAVLAVLLFLLSPVTITVAAWSSTRHYLEGLFFALLSLYLVVKRAGEHRVSLASGVLYLAASLFKEVYVVLPAIAILLVPGNARSRTRATLPLWAGLIVYTLWRIAMMGGLGGYPGNQPLHPSALPSFLGSTFTHLAFFWFGDNSLLSSGMLILVLLFALRCPWAPVMALVLFVPVFPVGNIFDSSTYSARYFFHITTFLICAMLVSAGKRPLVGRLPLRTVSLVICGGILCVNFVRDVNLLSTISAERETVRASASEFLSGKTKFIFPVQPYWFYESLRKTKREFYNEEITGVLVPPAHLLRYASPAVLEDMMRAGAKLPYEEIVRDRQNLREGPLSVTLELDGYRFSWRLGPDNSGGTYAIVSGHAEGLYYDRNSLPPEGSITLAQMDRKGRPDIVYLRIVHSPVGKSYEAVSPEFVLSIPGHAVMEYHSYGALSP